MEEVYYKKVGRKYVPVSYYDSNVMDAIPAGAHLIVKRPGSTSRRYNVDPTIAPMIAAGLYAEEAITTALVHGSKLRIPNNKQPITLEQREAWQHLAKLFGDDIFPLEWPSYAEAAGAGVKALQAEAEKLLSNPGVRAAYDHFILMCKLTQTGDKNA